MILLYYEILFALSIIFLLIFIIRRQIRFDLDIAVFFILVPIDILGYIKIATATNVETAILANQLVYLGGSFLQLLVLFVCCNLCHIQLKTWVRVTLFGISLGIYLCTLTIGVNELFYREVSLIHENGVGVLIKEYGPMHPVFYVMIVMYMLGTLAALIYGYKNKPEASVKNMYILTTLMILNVAFFFGGRAITKDIEFSPAMYITSEAAFLLISHRVRLYNITGDIAASVLEEGADGLICFDLNRRLLVYNKTALSILPALGNAQADHLLNETVEEFRQLSGALNRFMADESDFKGTLARADAYYQTRVEYIRDGKRNIGYYIVLRDVTTEHRYIESINRYNEQMKAATDAAIAADDAKTMFLAQMSHEIRTPINAVLGMNEMIMQDTEDERIYRYASDIQSSGQTLLFLINSILDFSKIEDGKMEILKTEYDTVRFITNLINSISAKAVDKGLKFEADIDETLPIRLIGDDMRLTQVIINLLSNAVKYTEEGSVVLSIRRGEKTRGDMEDAVLLHVEVKDTGIGIREEDMKRLFDSFERFDTVKNRRVEGTGLGMTIVYKLLELMGSQIYVKSVYGEGSVFWFDITQGIADNEAVGDYRERAAAEELRAKKNISLYAPKARILVTDDNALNLKVTRNYLRLCGIVPDEASSGREAIELMRSNKYDVVFLDHMMPELDGIETLEMMKSEGLIPQDTVMVVLTANAVEGSKEQYIAAGFDDYISKPVDLKSMTDKLEEYLSSDIKEEK